MSFHAVMLDPEADVVRLADLIGAPDFPTGGIITGGDPLAQIYATGRGRIVLEGRMHAETPSTLVISELPYRVSKGGDNGLIAAIAQLVHDRRLTGIADLADDSSRAGMRISIELERDARCDEVAQALLELTRLRTTIDIDMVAIVDGAPRTMGLGQLANAYLDHRRSVLGPDSDNRIRAELGQLATEFASPRRTMLGA